MNLISLMIPMLDKEFHDTLADNIMSLTENTSVGYTKINQQWSKQRFDIFVVGKSREQSHAQK